MSVMRQGGGKNRCDVGRKGETKRIREGEKEVREWK
jgi:hypothetical protein